MSRAPNPRPYLGIMASAARILRHLGIFDTYFVFDKTGSTDQSVKSRQDRDAAERLDKKQKKTSHRVDKDQEREEWLGLPGEEWKRIGG